MAGRDESKAKKPRKRKSQARGKRVKRGHNNVALFEDDKEELSKGAADEIKKIVATLKRIAQREKKQSKLKTELALVNEALGEDYAALELQLSNVGRHVDTVFGARSIKAKAYRADD